MLSTKRSDARTGGVGEPEITDLLRRLSNVMRYGRVHSADYPAARVRIVFGDESDPENHVVTAWIPWLTTRAGGDREWWAPEVGEAVLLLSPGGDLSSAVALPAIFSSAAPAPAASPDVHRTVYADGAVVEYDRAAHRLSATIPGDVSVEAEGSISAQAGGDISADAGGAVDVKSGAEATVDAGSTITLKSSAAVTIIAPSISIGGAGGGSSAATLTGNFTMQGNLWVEGSIDATGDIIAGGSNSNHHTH